MRDRDELILDILTALLLGSAFVCFLGLVLWPSVFLIASLPVLAVFIAIAVADSLH